MDKFQLKFLEEASELIADLEQALLILENSPEDKNAIAGVFRTMHTLKGNSAMFGFDSIGEFTHHLETIYDLVRQDKMELTLDIFNITLASVDHLKNLLNDSSIENEELKQTHELLTQKIVQVAKNPGEAKPEKNSTSSQTDDAGKKTTYHIFFKPHNYIFNNGTNPIFLLDELCGLGVSESFVCYKALPDYNDYDPSHCYLSWDIIIATEKPKSDLLDVFIFVEDDCELIVNELESRNLFSIKGFTDKLKEYNNPDKNIDFQELKNYCANLITLEPIKEKLLEKKNGDYSNAVVKENSISSIRVSSEKIDEMMNLVSELVTTQARLSLLVETHQSPELVAIAENMHKLSRQLRDTAFSISLIPLQSIITRFQRLVRDLSNDLGKEIDFITEGTETELDKTIIENLTDPLMHILRNSIDHGIEDKDARLNSGKNSTGKIILRAFYSGAYVYIEISDDGAGIDTDKVREKAIQKGLVSAEANLSKKEILDLVFLPGFSTAKKVTDVSGRGVGMDVVRRKISDIRGEVDIDSTLGKGTTITIKLPLTLSIIDGLLVKIHDTHFIMQLTAVDKIYSMVHEKLQSTNNNLIVLDGETIPFYYLRDEFGMHGEPPKIEQIIVVRYLDNKIGLIIDRVVGEYQAVIKPLGKYYKNQEMISGASILGDGTIALVTDTNKIIKTCSKEK